MAVFKVNSRHFQRFKRFYSVSLKHAEKYLIQAINNLIKENYRIHTHTHTHTGMHIGPLNKAFSIGRYLCALVVNSSLRSNKKEREQFNSSRTTFYEALHENGPFHSI